MIHLVSARGTTEDGLDKGATVEWMLIMHYLRRVLVKTEEGLEVRLRAGDAPNQSELFTARDSNSGSVQHAPHLHVPQQDELVLSKYC
jgi:hypothetical protein